ncbi:MAG: type IV pilus biogenesis/stability protein PilW [Aquitalea sp.]|nr:type IV pilus biogenesis/stability protein PilW [Aquitalea sp.]
MAVCLLAYAVVAFAAPANRKLAEIRSQLAVEYARLGNMPVALETANQAVQADDGYVGGYLSRAYVFSLMQQDAQAEQNFLKALQVDSSSPEANNNYGQFLCEHERPRAAMDYFAKAVANPLYQTPQVAYLNMGRCSVKLGETTQANDYLLTALRLIPDYLPALRELAALHLELGNAKLASFYFGRLRQLSGNNLQGADVLWLGVQIARKGGDRAAEAEYSSMLKNRYPDSRETQLLLSGS